MRIATVALALAVAGSALAPVAALAAPPAARTTTGTAQPDLLFESSGRLNSDDWRPWRANALAGNDIVILSYPSSAAAVDCGPGEDIVIGDAMFFYAKMTSCEIELASSMSNGGDGAPTSGGSLYRSGSDWAERYTGTPKSEVFNAGGGNDFMFGGDNPEGARGDLLAGGAGDDVIDTGKAPGWWSAKSRVTTQVFAGAGNDVVMLRGAARVDCGAGKDIVYRSDAEGVANAEVDASCEQVISV